MSRRTRAGLAACALLTVLVGVALQQDPPKRPRPADAPIVPAAALEIVPATRLSAGKTYDNQPAAAETADGTTWIAYVRYTNRKGDEVVAASVRDGQPAETRALTPGPGQYIRPTLAARGNDLWCFWTTTEPENRSTVWYARLTGGAWSSAARLLPDEARAHQNPEIALASDGRLAAVYQIHTGTTYDIHLRLWDGKAWAAPAALSDATSNDWDPVAAFDGKGALHVFWSAFRDGDYDICWSRDRAPGRRISARGEYDLHPWAATAPDGRVWVNWDVVRLPRHGNSGRTTITGANLRYMEAEGGYKTGVKLSAVDIRVVDGDTLRVPGNPREEIAAPKGFQIAHNALAKVAIAPSGEPWVFYRCLRRSANSAGIGFYWDLLARPFSGVKWGEAVRFAEADGYLEEAALAVGPRGIRVAYGGEHRNAHIPTKTPKPPVHDEAAPHDHHRDFDAKKGWNGEVFLALVGTAGSAPGALPEAKAPADAEVGDRLRIEPYVATHHGKTYRLLFGDTHRHSNVSRCSQGSEPSPDDLYRYGTDICRYDFFALSDHAEDPRWTTWDVIDYYWWKQQKLADLYHIPGFMSVLYNLEWSLSFPHGHHNTIFPRRPTYRLDRHLASSATLAAGWKVLEREGLRAITIPHTGADPGMGTAWEVQDDRYQRVCEIFQACRGSYEHEGCPREFERTQNKKGYYWNALEKGYHVGVIASTDHGYGVAYACVYAPENTREAVWQAMWDRRSYGSTTYGLVLDFRSGEHWMGEEWSSKEAPALEIYVKGARPIRSIEILGRSKVLHAVGSVDQPLNAAEHRLRWADPEWEAQSKEQWYYVRVIQVDDEMAWSSPVWVRPVR